MVEPDNKKEIDTETTIRSEEPQKTLLFANSNQELTSMEIENLIETIQDGNLVISSKIYKKNFKVVIINGEGKDKEKLSFDKEEARIYHPSGVDPTLEDTIEIISSLNNLKLQLNTIIDPEDKGAVTLSYIDLMSLNLQLLQILISKGEIVAKKGNIDIIEKYAEVYYGSIETPLRKSYQEDIKDKLFYRSKIALSLYRSIKHAAISAREK